jgi:hypothetical protein
VTTVRSCGDVGPIRCQCPNARNVVERDRRRADLELRLHLAAPGGMGRDDLERERIRAVAPAERLHEHAARIAAPLARDHRAAGGVAVEQEHVSRTQSRDHIRIAVAVHVPGGRYDEAELVVDSTRLESCEGRGESPGSDPARAAQEHERSALGPVVGRTDDHVGIAIAVHVSGRRCVDSGPGVVLVRLELRISAGRTSRSDPGRAAQEDVSGSLRGLVPEAGLHPHDHVRIAVPVHVSRG